MARNAMAAELEFSLGEGSTWSQLGWGWCDWLSPDGSERWVFCEASVLLFRLSDAACLGEWRVAHDANAAVFSLWFGDSEPVLALIVRREDEQLEVQRWSFADGESRCHSVFELASEDALMDVSVSEHSGCLALWCARHVVIDVIAGEVRGEVDAPPATESALPRGVFDRDRVRWVTNREIRTVSLDGAPTVAVALSRPLRDEDLTALDDRYALVTNASAPATVSLLRLDSATVIALDEGRHSSAWITDRSLFVRYHDQRVAEYALDTGERLRVIETDVGGSITRPMRGGSILECSQDGWTKYDRRSLRVIDELVVRSAPNALALHADGHLLAASSGQTLLVYDLRTRSTVVEHQGGAPLHLVEWLDSGALLVTKMNKRQQRFVECALDGNAVVEQVEERPWQVDAMTFGAQATRDGRARMFQHRVNDTFGRTAMVRGASGAWVELDVSREAMNPYEAALIESDNGGDHEPDSAIATLDCTSEGRWTRVTLTEDGATDEVLLGEQRMNTPFFARGVALCVERERATRARWYALSPDGSIVDLPLEACGGRVYFARDLGVFATMSDDRRQVFVVDLQGALRATIHLPAEQTATTIAMGHQGERVFVAVSSGEVLVFRVAPGDHSC